MDEEMIPEFTSSGPHDKEKNSSQPVSRKMAINSQPSIEHFLEPITWMEPKHLLC